MMDMRIRMMMIQQEILKVKLDETEENDNTEEEKEDENLAD